MLRRGGGRALAAVVARLLPGCAGGKQATGVERARVVVSADEMKPGWPSDGSRLAVARGAHARVKAGRRRVNTCRRWGQPAPCSWYDAGSPGFRGTGDQLAHRGGNVAPATVHE